MKNQVGGHEGITTSEDNSMIIKPTNSFEQDFYNQIPHYPNILPFIPRYYGSLSATTEGEGEKLGFQGEGTLSPNNPAQSKDIMICIQNISAYFNKPSILDLKMGTRLYDENNVTEEKKLRMIAKARATTSHSTGIRVTGMKVIHNLIHVNYIILILY
jgi:1D-myo-inositol-tetrakisphosphate 5-kinase/inositol-polyphosphate multikinase